MTKQILKVVWPVAVVVALAVSSLPAQAADIRCTVPFTFTVKGKTLPPGTYQIADANSALRSAYTVASTAGSPRVTRA